MTVAETGVEQLTPAPTARLRTALFYTHGQSLCGASRDDETILRALEEAGLDACTVDLGDLQHAGGGSFLLRDRATGRLAPWEAPHAALMYHGAIAPPGAMHLLRTMQDRGTVVVNGPDAWPVFADKHLFAQYMSQRGVAVIPTRLTTTRDEMRAALDATGGEAVFKKPVSTEGDDIFVVRGHEQLELVAERLDELDGRLIAQPLVDSRIGDDIEPGVRAQLLRDELGRRHEFRINSTRMPDGSVRVDGVYARIAPDETQVVNNVAQGARPIGVRFEDLHPADQQTVLDAARHAPPTGDIVGWDLIGQPGRRMVIEGNSGSGLPTGEEGVSPWPIVRTYAELLRHAASTSPLA
jgi:glutathione synthase/RimK-type ligase-like ATP-grasp enzyme